MNIQKWGYKAVNSSICDTVKDAKGNVFVQPMHIGGEERNFNIYEDLLYKANTEYFFEYAKNKEKQIRTDTFDPEKDFSNCDIISNNKLGGHEIYIKQSPENEDLLKMVEQTEDYPLIDESTYDKIKEQYLHEFFEDGTAQNLFKEKMTEAEIDLLLDLSYIPFSNIKSEGDTAYFPDDYSMSENDIIEYIAKSSNVVSEDILQNHISDETMETFREKFNAVIEQVKEESAVTPTI